MSELFAFRIIRHGGGTLVDNTSLFSRGGSWFLKVSAEILLPVLGCCVLRLEGQGTPAAVSQGGPFFPLMFPHGFRG